MFRRLILAALALAAFLALEGCGVSRVAAPAPTSNQTPIVDKHDPIGEPTGTPVGGRTDGLKTNDTTKF